MALPFSQFHFPSSKRTLSKPNHPNITFQFPQKPTINFPKYPPKSTQITFNPHKLHKIPKSTQEDETTTTTNETTTTNPPAEESAQKDLGNEIKKAMMEREQKDSSSSSGGFLSGVAEEIREIEWPAFNKVLGITGVVIGVIAGSSVVLLTLNAVLAELSDQVFAGRGVQDFFG